MVKQTQEADWRAKFPLSTIYHLSSHASDHLPIMLYVQSSKKLYKGQKGFKFEEAWLLAEGCDEVVKIAWSKDGEGDSGLELARRKVVGCATELQAWGALQTHPDVEEIKRLQKHIEALYAEPLNEENRVELLVTTKQLDALLLKQKVYWAQRSWINWMKHGGKNTKIFHSKSS